MNLLTIGHSNHEIEAFTLLLQKHQVTIVADVRSYPYSRFLPHFNQAFLKKHLEKNKIEYMFLGKELGARPNNRECYLNGKAVYERIAKTNEFQEGIEKILKNSEKQRISLMCAEKDPLDCHRAILVCQSLRHLNLEIEHILKNGDLETHSHLEERLLRKHKFSDFAGNQNKFIQLSLFPQELPTKAECLEKAYQIQGDKIAYTEKNEADYERAN